MTTLLAAIPYWTIPVVEIGPLPLRTFGLMVAVGVVLAVWFGAVHGEAHGVDRDTTYSIGTRMVLAGVVGARLTWVATHWDQIDSPVDIVAVWDGGLQFAGGFLVAVAVGMPTFLRWGRLQRWQLLDGYAVAVLVGAAFGRLGCLAVGEHFGRESDFFLATRWEGALLLPEGEQPLRELSLGLDPGAPTIVEGTSFLNPSLYEAASLFLLVTVLWGVLRRVRPAPGTVIGLFLVGYAVQRFAWDTLRVNDERVAGMTGAQWMCLAMVPVGIYVLTKVRSSTPALLAAAAAEAEAAVEAVPAVPGAGDGADEPGPRRSGADGVPPVGPDDDADGAPGAHDGAGAVSGAGGGASRADDRASVAEGGDRPRSDRPSDA